MKHNYILVALLLLVSICNAQIDIADAKTMGEDAVVTVRGIVTCDAQFNSSLRYIQDETAGIAVYSPDMQDFNLGDEVELTGSITIFNQLTEIVDLTAVSLISENNDLPIPLAFNAIANGFTETFEGMLVKFDNVSFVDAGSFNTGSDNYLITDGSTQQQLRVWGNVDIAGTPIPSENLSITGIMGQFNNDDNPTEGYQLQPRSIDDFAFIGGAPVFLTTPTQTNITPNSFDVCFETVNEGNTVINYAPNPDNLLAEVSDAALATSHCVTLTNLSPATVYYVQASSVSASGTASEAGVQAMMTASLSTGNVQVLFNQPVDNSVAEDEFAIYVNNAIADTVIHYINSAQSTLDIAIYNLDNQNGIIDAINAAHNNGVQVRVVANKDVSDGNYNAIQVGSNKRQSPDGEAPSGGFYGIMHNKFMIVDAHSSNPNEPIIITGSTNWTDGQLNEDPNNMLIIQDQSLAIAYEIEFNEMFEDNVFGPEKSFNTPQKFNIGGIPMDLYFSPSDDTESVIKEMINSADYDLYVALLTQTRFGISFEIADKITEDQIFVAGMVDAVSSDDAQFAFDVIADEVGDAWKVDNQPSILHHKYMIVDPQKGDAADPLVLTGSHNWSNSAQFSNDENTLIIHDANIANLYYQEWRKRYTDNGGNIFVGVADEINQTGIEVYSLAPNPTQTYAQLGFKIDEAMDYQIHLMDINGKLISTIQNKSRVGINNVLVQTAALNAGIYVVQFQCKDYQISQRLVVH